MSRVRIKICGINNEHDAELACRLGADAIGLNLYPGSKRHVAASVAERIAKSLPPFVEPVVLFVNEPLPKALPVAQHIGRTIQWHGEELPLPPAAPWRFVPAFAIGEIEHLGAVTAYIDRCRAVDRMPTALLLDGRAVGQYGGTGQPAPWRLLAGFDPGVAVILAGGLTAENVAEAIQLVQPYAVDVASGVESEPGRKDPDKLRRFIDAVNQASNT